jgi:transposase
LVFIDEAGAKTNMTRLRGRSPRGERVHDATPQCHWSTTTMISSVRRDGTTACMTVEGPTTGEVFRAYVEHFLVPTLRPGDIVILDNLSSHKDRAALALIEKAGAHARFLPPYSPDFNPIEKMWSKVKNSLRSAKARDPDTLLAAIGSALTQVTAQNAAGWFASCGYSII